MNVNSQVTHAYFLILIQGKLHLPAYVLQYYNLLESNQFNLVPIRKYYFYFTIQELSRFLYF